MANESNSSGLKMMDVVFLIFLVLKLTHTIDWSWWWITSPIWIPLALIALAALIIIIKDQIKNI